MGLVEQSNFVNLRFVQDSFLVLLDMGSGPAVTEALMNILKFYKRIIQFFLLTNLTHATMLLCHF
jgi:hypothetical protein